MPSLNHHIVPEDVSFFFDTAEVSSDDELTTNEFFEVPQSASSAVSSHRTPRAAVSDEASEELSFFSLPTVEMGSVSQGAGRNRAVTPSPPRSRHSPPNAPAVLQPRQGMSNAPNAASVPLERVDIVGGTHKGKRGKFVKRTPKKVCIQLDGATKAVYLAPHNVRFQQPAAEPTNQSPMRQPGTNDGHPSFPVGQASRARAVTPPRPQPQARQASAPQPTRAASGSTFMENDRVDIIGGTYEDKTGTVVKQTPSRVCVRLDGATTTEVYLATRNVRHQRNSRSRALQGSVDPTEATTVSPDGVPSSPMEFGPSRVRSPESPVSCRRHLRSQDASGASGLPDEDTTGDTSDNMSSWCLAGGEDSTLHRYIGQIVDYIRVEEPDKKLLAVRSTFAFQLFGHRVLTIKVRPNVRMIPREWADTRGDTRRYELLSTRHHAQSGSSDTQFYKQQPDISAYYVLVEGGGIPTIDLQYELEKVAAFGRLVPKKVASRLELFLSTAIKSTQKIRDNLIFDDLTSLDFEMPPEVANEGCGFIPREYIERFLGKYKKGKRTCALQVRIFSPKLGLRKGVLMEKKGISKIQLPPSMLKINPSEARDVGDQVCLTITGIFPSVTSRHIASILAGQTPPDAFSPKKLSDMMVSVLRSLSVPTCVLDEYVAASHGKRGSGLEHAFCAGVADPTNAIPPGHVFIPGIRDTAASRDELFVSRFPCTEAADGKLLPVLRRKPAHMSDSAWNSLNELHFGVIVFGNPPPGCVPLPQTIAAGDLDGDLYFVCWNTAIIESIDNSFELVDDMLVEEEDEIEIPTWNENWLRDGQDVMRNVEAMVDHHALIGKLYSCMRKAESSADAVWFGRAYKEAIDIGKHGGQVTLPAHLQAALPPRFHCYLTSN